MKQGIYEELISKLVRDKIENLPKGKFDYRTVKLDKAEAALILSRHLGRTIEKALATLKGKTAIQEQINVTNKLILTLNETLDSLEFSEDIVETEAEILKAVFSKIDTHFSNLDLHLKEITPYTRLAHSELFTGGAQNISLESELKKEILSSNQIDLLVSFIKWKGVVILQEQLTDFVNRGGKLRVISTTYMGASDYKAIEFLSSLKNTEVKISYNNGNERLHAKAYLFKRNTGFHTAYIGSSNFSRSALTDGLEWNIKVTTKEVSHIIEKFESAFETYWHSVDFEIFDSLQHTPKLKEALKLGKGKFSSQINTSFFDLKPYPYQLNILEKLTTERRVHKRYRNLIVAATGTGKTIIAGFDYKTFRKEEPRARLLFIAHRKEILTQAHHSFQAILRNANFGELLVDGNIPSSFEYVFASIQSLTSNMASLQLSPEYYDFIVFDEVHHIKASSYRPILNYFKPKVLLGLTATPERMDGGDIVEDFCDHIAAEIRLPEALKAKLLCPFQYFGISDNVDLSKVTWDKGKYKKKELSELYLKSRNRVGEIIFNLEKYTKDAQEVRALGFCVTIEHAEFMSISFEKAGFRAATLSSKNSTERDELKHKLANKEINYLFVVDIFNEGVDIPEVDTVLFLRPTESLTIFLQQLGRGLRLTEDKDSLLVLDFVANSKPEYDFEGKFRAMVGKTANSIQKEIEDNFPHAPLGCSIVLEKKAKTYVLENIKKATNPNRNQLIQKVKAFTHQTTLPLTLKNFLSLSNLHIEQIYKKGSWKRLCQLAGKVDDFPSTNEKEISRAIFKKWFSTNSISYFRFILNLAKSNFEISMSEFNDSEKKMLLMLHYDVWQQAGGFFNLEESIRSIGINKTLNLEIIEVLEFLVNKIDVTEKAIELPYAQPLKIHSRYTKDQIFSAFDINTFQVHSSNREGVAENKNLNTELLLVDLIKSEEDFSPTTMYNDYAINDSLFHWQSQSQTREDLGKGPTYIDHKNLKKILLLFVREQAKDQYRNTVGFVFLGKVDYQKHYGSKPMSITWKLEEPLPHYIRKASNKLGWN